MMLASFPKLLPSAALWRVASTASRMEFMQRCFSSSCNVHSAYVVFGAAGSIGSALARRIALEGDNKVVCIDKNKEMLDGLKSQLQNGEFMTANATVPEEVDHVLEKVQQSFGGIRGVANCAGDVVSKSTLATSLDDLHGVLSVNLDTAFNVVKSSVKSMMKSSEAGSIVLVSAAVAQHGLPNYEAMSAAKAAVEGLARSAAATYASKGIRINCVAPGLTQTHQTEKLIHRESAKAASKEMHPQKDIATPEDIAAALAFLLHPDSRFISGQVLAVDGGLSRLAPHSAGQEGA